MSRRAWACSVYVRQWAILPSRTSMIQVAGMSSSTPLPMPRADQRPVTRSRLSTRSKPHTSVRKNSQVPRISSRHQRRTCSMPRYSWPSSTAPNGCATTSGCSSHSMPSRSTRLNASQARRTTSKSESGTEAVLRRDALRGSTHSAHSRQVAWPFCLRPLDRRFDRLRELVGALAGRPERQRSDQLADPVPLQDVVDGHPGPAALGREVVAALGSGDLVLGALRPANARRRLELGDLELPVGLHAGVLDGALEHRPGADRSIRRLGDLEHARAELRVIGAVGEEREDLLDRTIHHSRSFEATRHGRSGYSHSIVPGGLDVMSSVTRFTCAISLIMREATFSSRS